IVSIGADAKAAKVERREMPREAFERAVVTCKARGELHHGALPLLDYRLANDQERTAEKGRFIVLGSFKGDRRKGAGLELVYGAGLDAEGAGVDEGFLLERLAGIAHVGHTSYSHTPQAPRWRVFVLFAKPITAAQFPPVHAHLRNLLGLDSAEAAKDAGRIWF